jgi:hypothetical protein
MTFGFNPRALCGVVVDPAATDRRGYTCIRIASNNRTYLARARWVRRLPRQEKTAMTYQFKDLSVLAYANGFTLWHYTTPDSAADVTAPGAWDPAADMLRAGDIIVANVDTTRVPAALLLVVTGVDGGAVATGSLLPAAA